MTHDREFLLKLAGAKMPFGKYEGRYLLDLPEYYIIWFSRNGYPKGQLGLMLQTVYELKVNGLEGLVRKLRDA